MRRTDRHRLDLHPRVRRQLAVGPPRGLPGAVAAAVAEFIYGPLAANPHRVGKPTRFPFDGQHVARCGPDYQIRYVIDEARRTVTVVDVSHRADTYRGH